MLVEDKPLEEKNQSGRLNSVSFVSLVVTQFLGAFNDNFFRWLAVPIAQPIIGTEEAVALGGVCLTLPYLLFTPIAGWLADRFPKKAVIVGCKAAEVLIMLLAVLTIVYGNAWVLFGLVFLMGIHSALFAPAKFGSLPEILPTNRLARGNGIMATCTFIAIGLGTIAGFSLYDLTEPALGSGQWRNVWPAAVGLLSISLLGLGCSLWIGFSSAADPDRRPTWNPVLDIVPALKVLNTDWRIMRAALGIGFFYFLASLSQLNVDPYGETVLGLNKTAIGLLFGILIAGVGVGSLLAGYWTMGSVELGMLPVGAFGIIVSSLTVFCSGMLVNPLLPATGQIAYWGSCVGLFFLGVSAGIFDVPLEAYLQFCSDRKNRGTILAGSYFISYGMIVFSCGMYYLLSGIFHFSATSIFVVTSLITIPVLIYLVWLMPDLAFRFVLWLLARCLYRLRVRGQENVPAHGGALIVCNHVSFMDGVLMTCALPRLIRFLIYTDFTQMPILKPLGEIMNAIPIRASDGPKAIVKSLTVAREAIQRGEVVCIYAEGGLTRTGQLQPFQRGLLKIVQGTNAPIIPAYLHGMWGSIFSWRWNQLFWRKPRNLFGTVDLSFGRPLFNVSDAALVRQEVERLGAEATLMSAKKDLIPARRFIRHCKKSLQRGKVVDSMKTALTGGRLLAGTLALRRVLRRSVFSAQEKNVGLLLPPSVGGCLANMAVALDGRVAVNLNYTLSDDVLNYCVRKAGLKHVLTSRKFLEKKPYALEGAEFVYLEDLKSQVTGFDRMMAALGAYAIPAPILERLLGLTRISPDETLTIVFTSGSTGEPKGVVLSHANIGSNIEAVDELLNLSDKDALLGVLPFFHSFGYTACLWLPMCYNVRGIYHPNPLDAKVVGRLCQDHAATIMMATPTFLKMYLRRCDQENFKSVDLIVVGAEKLPVELAKDFEEKFGILPTEGYGTTELSPVAAVNIPDHRSRNVFQQGTKLGTVGRPLPGVTAKVVDPETGENRGIGTEGLLLIKGPNVMQGYLHEQEKTDQVVHDGWYNTGDIAVIDTDGFVTITGRQSRFSKIGGEMVPHVRIEQELYRICEPPGGDEGAITLAVTSVPDDDRGERIVVLYTQLCKPVQQVIRELAEAGLPKLWLPSADSFIQVDTIPILGTGKLDLRGLKELALQAVAPETSNC
ncbi:acyl-[ACP]--phospholipid O-acyltransferase [Planctomicrobium sp. SH664]|uniref:acyl-[ACP]--phospholipid O-acyltransferase n=1 Tax=Planctomicrobium sp. SH664 TaxID=3448125 RepID=UPI003F5C0ABA